MSHFLKHTFFLLLIACCIGFSNAQDFWKQLAPIEGNLNIRQMAVDNNGNIYLVAGDIGVFRSIDGGETWEQTLFSNFGPYALTLDNEDNVYVAGRSLNVSKDNGATWENMVIPEDILDLTMVHCVGYDTLYLGGLDDRSAMILYSFDSGQTWERADYKLEGYGTAVEAVTGMVLTVDKVLYISVLGYMPTCYGGLFRSFDYGVNWERITDLEYLDNVTTNSKGDVFIDSGNTEVLRRGATTAEIILPNTKGVVVDSDDCLYAIRGQNIARSCNEEFSFENISSNTYMEQLHVGKDGFLYSYYGKKIFRSNEPIVTTTTELMAKHEKLILYPNPAKEQLTVSLQGTKEFATIAIYSILGEKIFEKLFYFFDFEQINLNEIPFGVYLLQIETSEIIYNSKFIKL